MRGLSFFENNCNWSFSEQARSYNVTAGPQLGNYRVVIAGVDRRLGVADDGAGGGEEAGAGVAGEDPTHPPVQQVREMLKLITRMSSSISHCGASSIRFILTKGRRMNGMTGRRGNKTATGRGGR